MAQAPYCSTDPATGEVWATFEPEAAVAPVLERAWEAYVSWAATPLEERVQVLRRAGALFEERAEELAGTLRAEMGKPLEEGVDEALYCRAILDYYAEHGPGFLADEPLESSVDGVVVLQRRPVGPLLGVMPWNYPAYQTVRFAAPNLLLGNTVLVKPAESTPGSALVVDRIFRDAGLPDGAYLTVLATHDQVAELIADDRVRGVSLTGSEAAGAAVAATAGRHLKKCVLELGGSDPFVVLDSDDVDALATLAWETRVYNNGQSCNSNKRMILTDAVHDEFVAVLNRLAGETRSTTPMASRRAAELLAAQVADAVADGATLTGGELGEGPAAWFAPAVLTGVTPQMRVHRQELFGPVAVVYRVADDAQAVALANDSDYGLGAAVFSTDPSRAEAVAQALEVGMVSVNAVTADGPELPFGGVKRSGFGRELGRLGLGEFVNHRVFHTSTPTTGRSTS